MHASPAYTETQLEALAGGEPAAFEQFYRDHHARIYNLVARVVGDPDDAADITQEVFLRAYTHPIQAGGDFRPEPWLYRIAVNASYDHLRRRAARPSTSLDTVAEIPDTGDGFVDGELAHCIENCLAGLTPRYRTALVLKDLHGLSHAEIAEVMDIHQGAARVLLHRARAAFRRAFRNTAPTGAGGVTMLGLAAFLPELPVPASLQTPPAFASLMPQAAWPATSAPHLAGSAPGAGQAGFSGATPAASAPLAVTPAVSVPLAVAPVAPVGLLAGLGGAAGVKVAIAVVAIAVVAGGGLAARHGAQDATSVDDPAGRVRAGGTTSQVAQPAGEPEVVPRADRRTVPGRRLVQRRSRRWRHRSCHTRWRPLRRRRDRRRQAETRPAGMVRTTTERAPLVRAAEVVQPAKAPARTRRMARAIPAPPAAEARPQAEAPPPAEAPPAERQHRRGHHRRGDRLRR